MIRIRNSDDVLAGVFLIAVALLALALSWDLRTGTAANMGPGYAPRLLILIQLAFGAAIVLQGLWVEGDRLEGWSARAIVWVLAGIAFFAVTIQSFGLAIATIGLVILSTLGHRGTRPVEAGLTAVVLAAFSVLVFVTALGLSMPVWPTTWVR